MNHVHHTYDYLLLEKVLGVVKLKGSRYLCFFYILNPFLEASLSLRWGLVADVSGLVLCIRVCFLCYIEDVSSGRVGS